MTYRCPYCGNVEKSSQYCSTCLNKIDWVEKVWNRSTFYYNQGLELAKVRDLSSAGMYLGKAVILNKYNIEARNLLGLIYFETGQIGEALKEWIISQSLRKQDNKATEYLEEVQKNPKMLSNYKEAITLYNKSLEYLKQKNMDMAIIRLKKAVSIHPKFVQAKVLLALSYMYDKQYYKANEQIKKALAIDNGHKEALLYFKELSGEDTVSVEPYERQYPVKITKDIKPSRVIERGHLLRRYLMYFLIGAASMFLIERYLILPSELKSYQDERSRLQESEATLMEKVQNLSDTYKIKVAELEKSKEQLEKEVTTYEIQVGELAQKEKLNEVRELVTQRSYIEAAQILYHVAGTKLDETAKNQYEALKQEVYPKAVDSLYSEGVNLYNQGEYIEAAFRFETTLLYEPETKIARRSLYYLGYSAMKSNDTESAKKYFEKIVADYEDTKEAKEAQAMLASMLVN